ncbi:MAG: NUDIX hydrolase, partial [Planctomycetota bacterium]
MFGLHPDSDIIHRGVRVTLRRATLPGSDHATHEREVVEAADAVVVLPLLDDGRVVMIRNERFALKETLWELPAGTVEPGEPQEVTAARELAEETGYRAARVERLTDFFPTPGFCTERLHAYRATGLTEVGQSLDATERIVPHVVGWSEAMEMVRDGAV